MEYAEIVKLLAEMQVEDSRQPALTKEEFPELLFECLCVHVMTQQAIFNSTREVAIPGLGGNIMAQAYAASLPADLSVNSPGLSLVDVPWWQAEVLAAMMSRDFGR